jgi:bifunctional non-homologous end joining protein LigD
MARKLSSCRAKRDATPPSARAETVAPLGDARYVIQKHARSLHYYLRLEVGGVFKTWSVIEGPSLDPNSKRLAVEMADHPLDRVDFDGAIPQRTYVAGKVVLWDRGFWAGEGDAAASLHRGELRFTLRGEKLHGNWLLLRLRHDREGGNRINWLMIRRG